MRASLERCAIPSAAASVVVRASELDTDADVVGALVCAAALLPANEGRPGHRRVHFLNSTLDVKGG